MTGGRDTRELLRSKNILIGLQNERERYNKRVDKTNEKIEEHNSELMKRWEKGEISTEEAEERHQKLLKKAHSAIYINNFRGNVEATNKQICTLLFPMASAGVNRKAMVGACH